MKYTLTADDVAAINRIRFSAAMEPVTMITAQILFDKLPKEEQKDTLDRIQKQKEQQRAGSV